ncbi:hypothetical protein Tco_0692937 [Tanacetum coccineum]
MFVPILVGKNNLVPISYLFYADDAMFIGKWSSSNVNVLMMMLHWFFLESGLKVNVHKSSLYGLGVHSSDIQSMANSFGCLANNLPFTYLDAKVASNIACINSWNEGPSLHIIYHCLKPQTESYLILNGLWLSVIKAIHGSNGSLDQPPRTCTSCSIWITIHKVVASLKSKVVDLLGSARKSFNLYLQKDASVAQKFQNPDFAVSFQRHPRGGIEESQFQELFLALFSYFTPKT